MTPSTRSRRAVLLDGPAAPLVRVAPSSRENSWEDVADLVASLGMPLDEWQEQVLEAAMGERSNGRWAAKYVGISAPRQNGKSQLIVARALAGVLLFGEKMVIISAHEMDTAREIWKRLLDVIESNPTLEGRVSGRMDAVGREFVSFGRGGDRQTIKLKARRASGSRGFSADCLLLDEGQILGKAAWGSINPTMSAMPNPQLWLFGTPPTEQDDPFAFSRVRESAKAHKARHAWLEWSAAEGDDFDDPETWAKANPSFGVRISAEACADDRAAMDDEQFAVERLGMWAAKVQGGVIPAQSWQDREDTSSVAVDDFSLGVEVGPDMEWAALSMAGSRSDGSWHVEMVDDQHTKGKGVSWLAPVVEELVSRNPEIRGVVVDVGGPIAPLVEQRGDRYWLKRADGSRGVKVTPLKVKELGAGCATLLNGVVVGDVWHVGQPQLTAAALSATKRDLADTGMWVWSRRNATTDITPIQACTYALIGAQMTKPKSPGVKSESKRRVVVLP